MRTDTSYASVMISAEMGMQYLLSSDSKSATRVMASRTSAEMSCASEFVSSFFFE